MTTYRLYPATNGPAAGAGDPSQYVFGLSFKVTSPGLSLQGWWWWVANTAQTGDAEDFALWEATGAGTGTYVTGSKVTSGTFTGGQWNFVACNTPIPLTSGQEYRAVKTVALANIGPAYTATANYFDTGGGGSGIVNGPLTGFAYPGAGTNPEPAGDGQMVFNSGATDVTTQYPASQFNETNYWLDVQVGTSAVDHTATAALTVTPSFSAAPTRGRNRTAALTVTPTFSAARTRGRNRTGALTVTPTFSAARTRGHYRTAALTVTPSFGNTRVRGHYRTGALAVHPAFSAARIVGHVRTSALTVTPSFYAVGVKPPPVVLLPAQVVIGAAGPSAAVADISTGTAVVEIASLAATSSQAVPVQGLPS